MNGPIPQIFNGGQMTDLPPITDTGKTSFDGTELFEVVSSPVGIPTSESDALNYQINSQQLAQYLAGVQTKQFINDGENITIGDPFVVTSEMGVVYVNKTVAEPTFIQFETVTGFSGKVVVADVGGTQVASPSANLITISFAGTEKASNNSTITIEVPYGGVSLIPVVDVNEPISMWLLGGL